MSQITLKTPAPAEPTASSPLAWLSRAGFGVITLLAIALFDFLSGQYSLRIGISTAHKGPETMHVAYNESIQSIKVQKQLQDFSVLCRAIQSQQK